ncbi:MAG: hypothetical protein SchgKO_14650 [Schleiferiaceae bacterium]
MKKQTITLLQVGFGALALFLAYQIYAVIMEPIEFEKLKEQRFTEVKSQLENIREAELAYKTQFGTYTGDLDVLISFVDTGYITIYERKDSSFMYYNRVFQKDMNKDTTIVRVIGEQPVRGTIEAFPEDFDASTMKYIYGTNTEISLASAKIDRGGISVDVFEASAPETVIFEDVQDRFDQYISKSYSLQVGSLTEPTISGNWK